MVIGLDGDGEASRGERGGAKEEGVVSEDLQLIRRRGGYNAVGWACFWGGSVDEDGDLHALGILGVEEQTVTIGGGLLQQ